MSEITDLRALARSARIEASKRQNPHTALLLRNMAEAYERRAAQLAGTPPLENVGPKPEHQTADTREDALLVVGLCLQSSFSAENHDSLGDELTRLLLHLSQDVPNR